MVAPTADEKRHSGYLARIRVLSFGPKSCLEKPAMKKIIFLIPPLALQQFLC